MSKSALAEAYLKFLEDEEFRDQIAADPEVLTSWDLEEDEMAALVEEAMSDVVAFGSDKSPVIGKLVFGPPDDSLATLGMGGHLNLAGGLPDGVLSGGIFASSTACCPWNKGMIPLVDRDPTTG